MILKLSKKCLFNLIKGGCVDLLSSLPIDGGGIEKVLIAENKRYLAEKSDEQLKKVNEELAVIKAKLAALQIRKKVMNQILGINNIPQIEEKKFEVAA